MSLIAEHIIRTMRQEKHVYDMSHHLVVAGSLRPDGSYKTLHVEVTEDALRDLGRRAIKDAAWKLCEMFVDDLCDHAHWRAAGPLLSA